MLALSILCVAALILLVLALVFVYMLFNSHGDVGIAWFLLAVACSIGFGACTHQAVIRADAIDKEPQQIIIQKNAR